MNFRLARHLLALALIAGVIDRAAAQDDAPPAADAPAIELRLPTARPSATAIAPEPTVPDDELGQLFFAAGVREATLAKFRDDGPVEGAERAPLVGLFASLRQFKPEDWEKFAQPLKQASGSPRGKLWKLDGTLKTIAPERFTPAELDVVYGDVEFDPATDAPGKPEDDPRRTFYRCELTPADGGEPLTIYSLAVPSALRSRTKLDERSGVAGLAIKQVAGRPVLVAERLAWYPHTPLGDAGMDYALYDDVRNTSEDLANERECMFHLFAAMKKLDFAKLMELTRDPPSMVPLFNAPRTMLGELTAIEGQARRCVRVIADDELHRRFGVPYFYEIDLFTAFSQDNPLIFNVLTLPPGFPEGNKIREDVRIPGTLLTGFVYDRPQTEDEIRRGAKKLMQKAPLLIGKTIAWTPVAPAESTFNWWVNGAVLAVIVAIAFAGWRTLRGDSTARSVMERTNAPTGSLNDLPGDFRSGPDFSNLEEK